MQQPASQRSRVLRRRPTPDQGRALEKIGHAIEYLMFINASSGFQDGASRFEAYRILTDASQAVFAECAPVVPLLERLRKRLSHMLHMHQPLRSPVK